METIQLSENTIFVQGEETAALDGKFGAIILMPKELAALEKHLTAKVLGEIEAELRDASLGKNTMAVEEGDSVAWWAGYGRAMGDALSILHSRLPERKEDGKV